MFCKHCGKEVADDCIFCSTCGQKIEANVHKQEKMSTNEQGESLSSYRVVRIKSYLWISVIMIPAGIFMLSTLLDGLSKSSWGTNGIFIIGIIMVFVFGLIPLFAKAYAVKCPYCGSETLFPIKATSVDCSICNKKIIVKNGYITKMSE